MFIGNKFRHLEAVLFGLNADSAAAYLRLHASPAFADVRTGGGNGQFSFPRAGGSSGVG